MQWFAHTANVLFLCSFLVRDILWLRLLSVVGGAALLPYYVYSQAEILWVPMGWNLVFMTINSIQSYRLFLERRPVRLSADERLLYDQVFSSLSPRAFLDLLAVAQWREVQDDEGLVQDGKPLCELLLIAEGSAAVQIDSRQVASLAAGSFVGEMSYLTGQAPSASVVATSPSRVVAWPCEPLRAYLAAAPEVRSGLQLILGTDLAHKLRGAA
jgi:Popeye protein conserved region